MTQVDKNLCTLCGLCVDACPCGAVQLEEDKITLLCDESSCDTCLETVDDWCLCEEVCPTGAITCAFEIVMDAEQDEKKES